MNGEKFYFICYEWRNFKTGTNWSKANKVIEFHPVIWLKHMVTNHEEDYNLLFWEEITKEQFKIINGWID